MTLDGLRWEVRVRGVGPPLLLVHGFTGRATSWGEHARAFAAAFRVITVDLPGHGRSGIGSPERMTVERSADDLAAILRRLDAAPARVVGYSLGARIALRLAVAHPAVVERLVLESPSAGIETEALRSERRAADEDLARQIERDGVEAFVAAWERQPIFTAGPPLPEARARRIRAIRRSHTAAGLAASLRGAGQGSMEPLFDRLASVGAPSLVLAGALDERGRPRAERVAAGIPHARLAVIDGAGHAPHDDQPRAFRRLALDFLEEDLAA